MSLGDEDATPTDRRSTIEIFADDMRATKEAAQNAETNQLLMYAEFKLFRTQQSEDRQRMWLPTLISVVAALVSFACAVAAAR